MGNVTQEIGQQDFSGGVNAVTDPYLLTRKQVSRVRNMILDEHGSLSTRDGYTVVTTSPDTSNPIVYRSALNTTDGTSYGFAIQNNGVANTVYRTDSEPWPLVGATLTSYVIPQSATVTNLEVFAMGYEVPWTWSGTVWANITAAGGQTVPPGANHLAFHLGSLWLWNTNATTTTLDGPSSLRMSDPNNINSWPNANQTFVAKDDGQQGMGMSTYTIVETGISPTSTLVLFKNYSAYQVTGVFGATNFTVQRVKSDMGCVAPRTIQFVSGFGIIRLTHKGFALYNGVDDKLISEEVRPYIFGHDDISALNFSAVSRAYAAQDQNPPLYVCAAPVDGNTLTRVFVYDLVRRAWTICDFPIAFQSLSLFITPTTQPIMHAGTATGGQIVSLFTGATTDNGTAVTWSLQTRSFFLGSFMRPTYWRRAILDMQISTATPATVSTALVDNPTSVASTRTFNTQGGTASLYGSAIYGVSVYGTSITGAADVRQSYDIMRTTPSVALSVTGSGIVRVRGLALHAVAKKLTGVYA